MSKNKFSKDGILAGKGFYIALAVCLIGAGGAAWAAVDRTLSAIDTAQPPATETDPAAVGEENDAFFLPDSSVKAAENPVTRQPKPSAASSEPQATPSEQPASSGSADEDSDSGARQVLSSTPSASAFCLPISSEIVNGFSGDTLVKNVTLNTWRTHNGVDFPAEQGAAVTCAFTGQVTKIYNDPMWGQVVEITGKDDLVAVYSGLDGKLPVSVGEVVKAGAQVGTVGEIPCESASDSHLHFAVRQDGKYIDPMSIR